MALMFAGEKADFLDRYKGNVAINVKFYGNPLISEETQQRLKKLDGATRDNVLRYAEEALRDSWWSVMQERSRELGLGNLHSDGRSGGWLVFQFSISWLEERFSQAEEKCVYCDKPYAVHIEQKCPFDGTYFKGDEELTSTWHALKQFSEEVKTSLPSVGDGLEDEILFQLENLDDDTVGFSSGGSESDPEAFKEQSEG